jgi:hypothetical protein
MNNNPRQPARKSGQITDWICNDIDTARNNLKTAGFTSIDTVFSSQSLSELRSEALHRKKDSVAVCGTYQCQYKAHLAGLGSTGIAFLAGDRISQLLDILFGLPLTLQTSASCYTYYQPGDFLDPHLDDEELCLVTVILYLDVVHSDKRADKTGLELHILGKHLSADNKPQAVLPTQTGSLIIGLGSAHWHKRPTLQNGEFVTAITACYSRSRNG